MAFRFIVTGDRNWTNADVIRSVLDDLKFTLGPDVKIVHGSARGADLIVAALAADIFGADHVEAYPADWEQFGKRAGPIRNQLMLTTSMERAILDGYTVAGGFAFHDNLDQSKGTKDMVTRMEKAGIPVIRVTTAVEPDRPKCTTCKGRGYYDSPSLWDGRAECGACDGFGLHGTALCRACGKTLDSHMEDGHTECLFDDC